MEEENSRKPKHDARNEFSKLLVDVCRRNVMARGVDQEEWLRGLEDFYLIILPFISDKQRAKCEDYISIAYKSLTIKNKQSSTNIRDVQANITERKIFQVNKYLMECSAPLLTAVGDEGDDDLSPF